MNQEINARGRSGRPDLKVQRALIAAEFEHVGENRNVASGSGDEICKRGVHGDGVGVVAILDECATDGQWTDVPTHRRQRDSHGSRSGGAWPIASQQA